MEDAFFATKALSKVYPIPLEVSACIAANSGLHADNVDSVFRLSGASRAVQDENLPPALGRLFLVSSLHVIQAFLKRKPVPHEEEACSILFSNISFLPARGIFWSDTLRIFSLLVSAMSPVVTMLRVREDILVLLVHDALESGLLSLKRDGRSIKFLLDHLMSVLPEEDMANFVANGYFGDSLNAVADSD